MGSEIMIYTVTLNPALDYIMDVSDIAIGETNRSRVEKTVFGGKGLNVSYILKELGVQSKALGFYAGYTGNELIRLASNAGISTDFIELEKGETRINVKLRGKNMTEINACGPEISTEKAEMLIERLASLKREDVLVISGSIPKNAPAELIEKMLSASYEKGAKAVLDLSDKSLIPLIKCFRPWLIKPNKSELEALFGAEINGNAQIFEYAEELRALGAGNVLVSMGGEGAVLLSESGERLTVDAHKVDAVNTVGAGDSMVAGFIAGSEKGYPYALRLANACGGASASTDGLATKEQIYKLM